MSGKLVIRPKEFFNRSKGRKNAERPSQQPTPTQSTPTQSAPTQSTPAQSTPTQPTDTRRYARKEIAESTLKVIKEGSYQSHDLTASLALSEQNTQYYAADSSLSKWVSSTSTSHPTFLSPKISLLEISTLEGARLLHSMRDNDNDTSRIGILNFASAKKPGGGFLSGASAQEESIARSSTLYPSLISPTVAPFYTTHNKDPKKGYYSHAMIYSPHIVLIKDDTGNWAEPLLVDIVTSPAVNAGVARREAKGEGVSEAKKQEVEQKIADAMRERMGRILFLFESQGVKDVVLGSFGTGVFRNDVGTVARIWAELLLENDARFAKSFGRIVFAVLGRETFVTFGQVFGKYGV